ncbi:hypothetical protein [Lentzea atacamensis]|uniref:hypothetical protein n=1 Tax=Lentzea atacamensis TaxID=531938 RepID=UPI000D6D44A6|nr:hypothetical protein [Lentzea atacamensis]
MVVLLFPVGPEQQHVAVLVGERGQCFGQLAAQRLGIDASSHLALLGCGLEVSGRAAERPVPPLLVAGVAGPAAERQQEGLAHQVVRQHADPPGQVPVHDRGVPVEDRRQPFRRGQGLGEQVLVRDLRRRLAPPGRLGGRF